jgi:hypothetical protein
MGTIKKLADEVERGLAAALPGLRKTVAGKLSLAVGAMIEGRTPNTVELANLLPLKTERQDMREQWLRRLLKNPLLRAAAVMEPFAREALARAARNGQTVRAGASSWRIRSWDMLTAWSGCSSSCRWRCTGVSASARKTRCAARRHSKKNASAKRPWPLELQETPPQHGVLVHTGPAPPEAVPAKRHPFAHLSSGYEKLIGDERCLQQFSFWTGRPG